MHQVVAGFGYVAMVFLAWLMSSHRTRFPWRIVLAGTLLQMTFALLILKTQPGRVIFQSTGDFFTQVQSFVDAGSGMVFGKGYEEHYIAFRVLLAAVWSLVKAMKNTTSRFEFFWQRYGLW